MSALRARGYVSNRLGMARHDSGGRRFVRCDGVALWAMALGALLFFEKNSRLRGPRCAGGGGSRWLFCLTSRRGREGGDGCVAVALSTCVGDFDGAQASSAQMAASCSGLEWPKVLRLRRAADAAVFGGGVEADEVALHLGVPEEELSRKVLVRVDAVSGADIGRVLELDGAAFAGFGEGDDAARMMAEAS